MIKDLIIKFQSIESVSKDTVSHIQCFIKYVLDLKGASISHYRKTLVMSIMTGGVAEVVLGPLIALIVSDHFYIHYFQVRPM